MNSPSAKRPIENGLTHREIEDLIVRYRSGDLVAAQELLDRFKPLVGKYLNLFFYGKYDPNDKDVCKFISCFGKKDLEVTASLLRKRLKCFERDELVGIAHIALLETASKFVSIYGCYKFVLHSHIKDLLIDDFPDRGPNMELSEMDLLGSMVKEGDGAAQEIDEKWVAGKSSNEAFSQLTVLQRKIVKLVWNDNMPDYHVSVELGISRPTLKSQKEIIREVLAKALHIKT